MKKLLTILALALALCMLCCTALATQVDDDTDSEFKGNSYDDPTRYQTVDGDTVTGYSISKDATCTSLAIVRFTCAQDPTHFHEKLLPLYPYGHDWVYDHTESEPTCTEKGKDVYKCAVCGEYHTFSTPALGHIWSSEYPNGNWRPEDIAKYKPSDYDLASQNDDNFAWGRVTVEPTCKTPGEAEDFCPRCGAVNSYVQPRVIEPIAHVFGVYMVKAPTCKDVNGGEYYIGCKYCGVALEDVKDETDGMGNRLYDDAVTKFTIDGKLRGVLVADFAADKPNGVNGILNTFGGFVNWNPPLDTGLRFSGHDWDKWVTESPASCYAPEHQMRGCKICGDKQERDGRPALPPTYKIVSYSRLDSCYKVEVQIVCTRCNSETKNGVCPHPAYFCVFENNVAYPTDATAADGTTKTLKELLGEECPVGVAHVEAHAYKKEVKYFAGHKDPNCQEDGFDAYYCIYETTKGVGHEHPLKLFPIEKLEHKWGDWIERVAPGEQGNEFGYWLRQCEREIKNYKDFNLDTMTASTIASWKCWADDERFSYYKPEEFCAEGHHWTTKAKVAPTCVADGSEERICSVCGKNETIVLPATGHDFEEEKLSDPTCSKAGKLLKTCKTCGAVVVEDIPVIKHTVVDMEGKEATCQTTGLKGGKWCEVCHTVFEEQEVIPADPSKHVWDKDVIIAASCTTEGKEIWTCEVCGKIEKVNPAKLAHVEDEGTVTKEATTTEEGEKTFKCVNCGEVLRTEKIDKLPVPAEYKLEDVTYEGTVVTGKIVHTEGTELADKLSIRVTFFISGNTYMTTSAVIYEDGTFEAEGAGVIEHVTLGAYATEKVVNPADLKDVTCFGTLEFDVE